MQEIKCPHCGETIKVDESFYQSILQEVKTKEFSNELAKREKELEENLRIKKDAELAQLKISNESQINELKSKIELLTNQLENKDNEKTLAVQTSLQKSQDEIARLKAQIESEINQKQLEKVQLEAKYKEQINALNVQIKSNDTDKELALAKQKEDINNLIIEKENKINELIMAKTNLKEQYEKELKYKDEEIKREKEFKARLSTKDIGESLEQFCKNEFEKYRNDIYPNAYFEKDNESVKNDDEGKGTKGDFIFRDFLDDKSEYISIMFEMKNEAEETEKKQKNEQFFKKLDDDRKKKKCEYAILVSMLEEGNPLYESGIYEVPRSKFEKMYVIRPQFFMQMISILKNAALNTVSYKKDLIALQNKNIDITNFEDKLTNFKSEFAKSAEKAGKNFQDAIKEIDKAIKELQTTREKLIKTGEELTKANQTAEAITIKKLTYGNPTMKQMFKDSKGDEE